MTNGVKSSGKKKKKRKKGKKGKGKREKGIIVFYLYLKEPSEKKTK